MKLGKNNIDFKSFGKKAPNRIDDSFGVFMVNGRMGSGKTYLCVYFAYHYFKNIKIKTNIHSLNIPDQDIEYFDKLDEVTDDIEENVLYIIDEISKNIQKEVLKIKNYIVGCNKVESVKDMFYLLLKNIYLFLNG